MPSKIKEVVFSEPTGRAQAFVMFASSAVMVSIFIYFDILSGVSSIHSLVMAVGFALSGLAESLPSERRQLAGQLRVTAILLLTGLLVFLIFTPEIFLGSQ